MRIHSDKTKQFFFVLIKISLVLAAFYFIYYKLTSNSHLLFNDFTNLISNTKILSLKHSAILLFLSLFNWLFEALKWKTLIDPVKKIDFKTALKQSLGALTASLFTPNRIGEYGAKALYYESQLRKKVLLVNLISNTSQMLVTICLGSIGFIFYISKYKQDTQYTNIALFILSSIIVIILTYLVICKSKFSIRGFSLEKLKQFMTSYPKKNMCLGLILSFLRYSFFSFQFYVLLRLFEVDISYFDAMVVITSMYLLASIIPSIFIFDVVVKTGVAVYLFSYLNINELYILSISTLMWILNFVLPSIVGCYFVLHFKPVKNTELV